MRGLVLIRRVALVVLVILVFTAVSLVLRKLVLSKGLDWTAQAATVGALVLPIAGLIAAVFRRWWSGPPPVSQLTIDDAIERLAAVFLTQWSERNADSQVYDPGAMRVQFKVTKFTQSLMTTVSLGAAAAAIEGHNPGDLEGGFDNILDVFSRTRRLIITGPAGSGKSVLAMKLACDIATPLLNPREDKSGASLPFLLKASTLKSGENLNQWMAREIATIDRELTLRPRGALDKKRTLAETIAASRIIPIIDGIDELPAGLRGEAVRRINEAGSDRPLVVTSRPTEYSGAVAAAGREISRAAVVEMLPLSLLGVESYLRESAMPHSLLRWQIVFDRLAAAPAGPLAAALTNPLMLWLCRRIYSAAGPDPAELVARRDLVSRRAIENHLLDAFLPAIYRDGSGPWTADQARQWLGFLAEFMEQTRSAEIAWWRFGRAVWAWRALTAALRGALLAVLTWRLVFWVLRRAGDWHDGHFASKAGLDKLLLSGPLGAVTRPGIDRVISVIGQGPVTGICHEVGQVLKAVPWSLGLVALVMALLSAASSLDSDFGEIRPVTIKLTRGIRWLARFLTVLLISGFACVLMIEAIMAMPPVPAPADERPATRGLFVLALLLLAIYLVPDHVQTASADVYSASKPSRVLTGDRVAACVSAVLNYAISVIVIWLCCGFDIGVSLLVLSGTRALSGLIIGSEWASSSFVGTRLWLAASRRMPLRTLAFLEDAHRRGALGRTGVVYQFRHLRLQRRLAEGHIPLLHRVAAGSFGSLILDFINQLSLSAAAWTHPAWARQFAEQAAALTDRIGHCGAVGPVYDDPPGVAQRFHTADDRQWIMCALPGRHPVLVSESIWNLLHDMRAATDGADALKMMGYPAFPASVAVENRIIQSDTTRIELFGGRLGPAVLERGSADGSWRWNPRAALSFTQSLTQRYLPSRRRIEVKISLPGRIPEVKITPSISDRAEERLKSSDFAHVLAAFGSTSSGAARILPRIFNVTRYVYRWHIPASAAAPEAEAVITATLSASKLQAAARILIRERRLPDVATVPGRDGFGFSLQQLADMLAAAWEAAADVIPEAIFGTFPGVVTGSPTVSFSMRAPSTSEEAVHLGTWDNKPRAFIGWTASLSGPVVGLPDGERERYVREALTWMAGEFGYEFPDDWERA